MSAVREYAWPLTLAAATIGGTLASACMMPFVGLAILAAATMPRGAAVVTVAGTWGVNQLLGFTLLAFPLEGYALGWGAALGLAAMAVVLSADRLLRARPLMPLRVVGVFVAGFALFELLLLSFAAVAGGLETFTPAIVLRLFANDALWLCVLGALYVVLTRGAPRWYPRRARAA